MRDFFSGVVLGSVIGAITGAVTAVIVSEHIVTKKIDDIEAEYTDYADCMTSKES